MKKVIFLLQTALVAYTGFGAEAIHTETNWMAHAAEIAAQSEVKWMACPAFMRRYYENMDPYIDNPKPWQERLMQTNVTRDAWAMPPPRVPWLLAHTQTLERYMRNADLIVVGKVLEPLSPFVCRGFVLNNEKIVNITPIRIDHVVASVRPQQELMRLLTREGTNHYLFILQHQLPPYAPEASCRTGYTYLLWLREYRTSLTDLEYYQLPTNGMYKVMRGNEGAVALDLPPVTIPGLSKQELEIMAQNPNWRLRMFGTENGYAILDAVSVCARAMRSDVAESQAAEQLTKLAEKMPSAAMSNLSVLVEERRFQFTDRPL